MKVGIMTFVDHKNYGNRLQNYALQEFLKKFGFEVETIRNDKWYDTHFLTENLLDKSKRLARRYFWKIYRLVDPEDRLQGYELLSAYNVKKRIQVIKAFTKRHIKMTDFIIREGDDYNVKLERYTYVFMGSDQIWNPLMGGASELFFLPLIKTERKIIFSASIGLSRIPERFLEQWRYYLSTVSYISVREDSAVRIIKEMGKDAQKIVDPTLLLENSYYDKLVDESALDFSSDYLCVCLLGDTNTATRNSIRALAESCNLDVVDVYDKGIIFGVEDYLYIIKNAKCVITDSFHACIFSIIFKTPFSVIKREGKYNNIYSRVEDLLKTFSLSNRECCDINKANMASFTNEEIRSIEEKRKIYLERAYRFVRKACNLNEDE